MGIRFNTKYSGRLRFKLLIVTPVFTVQPSISPDGGPTGITLTGNDGMVHAANITNREWLLDGVPIYGQNTNTYISDGLGSLTYRVTAVGLGGTVVAESTPVTITSNNIPPSPPTWNTLPGLLGTFAEGSSISVPVLADDPDNNISTYQVTNGQLPPGTNINMFTGVISGTLAEVTEDSTFTFTVKVTDRTNLTLTGEFSINVANVKTTVTWDTSGGTLADTAPGEPITVNLGATSV